MIAVGRDPWWVGDGRSHINIGQYENKNQSTLELSIFCPASNVEHILII